MKRRTYGPQHTHNGCVGCSNWPEQIEHRCSVEGCDAPAVRALMTYFTPSPLTGARNWFWLCGDHGLQLHLELFVNVGGNGPFDQDYRLRMADPSEFIRNQELAAERAMRRSSGEGYAYEQGRRDAFFEVRDHMERRARAALPAREKGTE